MTKANEVIDRLIGLNDIKIGNEGYFKNNILESLLIDKIASFQEGYNPNLKDLINISFGGKFGKDKNWGIDTSIGPSSNWGFNLSREF